MPQVLAQDFTAEERRNYIGGSDISAVMGFSRYKTALELYCEKSGLKEPADLSDNEKVYWGNVLEDVVAKEFMQRTSLAVRKRKLAYTHDKYPFLKAHVDRIVEKFNILLECKTCDKDKRHEWADDKIPYEYILQVNWNLGLAKRNIAYIAVLIGGNHYEHRKIEFDKELFDMQVKAAVKFWNDMLNNIPPEIVPEDNNLLFYLYPNHTENIIEATEIESAVGYRLQILNEIKELKAEQEKLEIEIKQMINSNLGILTPNYKITWNRQTKTYVDTEKLKQDGLYYKYSYSKETRALRTSKRKAA